MKTHNVSTVQTTEYDAKSLSVGDGFLVPFEPKPRAAIVVKIEKMPNYPGHINIWYKHIYRGAKGDMQLQVAENEVIQALW